MTSMQIQSSIRDYTADIETSPEFLSGLSELEHACYIVDENVWRLYKDTILCNLPAERRIILPISEDRKNLDSVQELYGRLVEFPEKRNLKMVSIGGGILQDITGFAASTIYRGINWIFVPTTLLAQADSCIGSKTSLNYGGNKNLLGTFFPPSHIHIFPDFIKTLAEADFYSGLGEVIKLALMGGRGSVGALLARLPGITRRESMDLEMAVRQSLETKLSYMAGDEFDLGRRRLLNFGHDVGHALESTSHFEVPHGQAVMVGMLAANIISARRSLLSAGTERALAESLLLPYLKIKPTPKMLDQEAILEGMKKDKKRTGANLALIMMDEEFDFTLVHDLRPEELSGALEVLRSEYLS